MRRPARERGSVGSARARVALCLVAHELRHQTALPAAVDRPGAGRARPLPARRGRAPLAALLGGAPAPSRPCGAPTGRGPSATSSTCSRTRRARASTSATPRATRRPTSSPATARMKGVDVLHPMGWDAFGLPAEQHAISTGTHPAATTAENIATFKRQLKSLGFSYDWSREIDTTDPGYVRWTQWIFLQLFQRGLAYQDDKVTGELVPRARHRARQRGGHRRPERARQPPGRARQAAAVDDAHHRVRRPARSTTSRCSTGRRARSPCSASGLAAPRAPRIVFAVDGPRARPSRSSPRAPTR